jgi:hypothetical protein
MKHVAPRMLGVLVTGATGWALGGVAAVCVLAGFAVVVAAFSRCRHPGPLGLLPPVMGDDGERRPARWFCEACGRTWPAQDHRGAAPVARFEGYDQAKAVEAAKRADDIDRRRREIAMERGSHLVTARPVQAKRERAPRPIEIHDRRAG